jgi:hypothetical protein
MTLVLVATVLALQFGPRTPLAPAETLLPPDVLRAIDETAPAELAQPVLGGSEPTLGEIVVTCAPEACVTARVAAGKLKRLIDAGTITAPARRIRLVLSGAVAPEPGTRAVIHLADPSTSPALRVIGSLWSAASVADEVVTVLAGAPPHGQNPGAVVTMPYTFVGQPRWEDRGIPAVAVSGGGERHAAHVVAAAAYFLATLPNDGAEALLSHLTVGAHARLAEDGRRAVAQMGPQQRASADVLIFLGQAIEREQRRMRSFERFMPEPVDPMLQSRLADMEKAITSVWTSLGITSSPFVPAAERIRGRGGEDRRVPARADATRVATVAPPAALQKLPHVLDLRHELWNFMDGRRSISDIRDAVSAEFGAVPLPAVVEYVEALANAGAVALR